MYSSTPDYNQHMLAFLHAWRQFLEQMISVTAIGYSFPTMPSGWPTAPFMPPAAPFMPPFMPQPPVMPQTPTAPVPPPAPGDYSEQLFGYLQAWRQYLEQAAGTRPAPCPAYPPAGPSTPPGGDDGGPATAAGPASKGSSPQGAPLTMNLPPTNPGQSLGPPTNLPTGLTEVAPVEGGYKSQFRLPGVGQGPDAQQLLNPPDYAYGYIDRSIAAPDAPVQTPGPTPLLEVASPFSAVMKRAESPISPPPAPKSLFSTTSAELTSATIDEAGQTHSL